MAVEDGLNDSAGQRVSQETVSAVSNSKPFAPIKMNNDKSIDVLFNTGSDSSLLSIDILEALGIEYTMEKCDEVLQGVEGTPLQIMGTTVLRTTFNNQTKNIRFTVLKDKDVAILGLRANVFLANCEVIPARGHKIVYGYVKGPLPDTKECLLEIDYASSRYGLTLPPVVCETNQDIPIYIYNCLSHPLKLKKNAKLGSVSPTTVDETDLMVMEQEGDSGVQPVDDHPLPLVDISHLDETKSKEMSDLIRDYSQDTKNKMRVTEQWKVPVDKATTISFVQFCSFLCRSIPDFARIAKPLYEISQQDRKFEWTSEANAAFLKLKEAISTEPVLQLPDYSKSFWIFSDWSKVDVGYVMAQRENEMTGKFHPVVWGSQMLNKSWSTKGSWQGELFAFVWSLQSCTAYLDGTQKIVAVTDHHT